MSCFGRHSRVWQVVRQGCARFPRLCAAAKTQLPQESFVDNSWKIQDNYSDTLATLVSQSGHTKIPLMGLFPQLKTVHDTAEEKRAALETKSETATANAPDGGAGSANTQAVVPSDKPRVRV